METRDEMGERGLTELTLPVPCAVLETLLSAVPAGADAELRSAGHGTGLALAERIRESTHDSSPSWDAIGDAWEKLGLGRFSRSTPGPGLMEIVVEEPGLPSGAPEFVQGLLAGLIESFASEPVGVAIMSVADTIDDTGAGICVRFLVGAPELIARLRPGLDSGRSIRNLMEEIWS
jgi:hypothetical protein